MTDAFGTHYSDAQYLDASLPERLMAVDRHRCLTLQRRIRRERRQGRPSDALERQLFQVAVASQERVERREAVVRALMPAIAYPPELPVSAEREHLLEVLREHQVVILAGETGSGKTTQLPKLCLEAGCGRRGRIGHTQPRRLAATSVAARIADELGTAPGELIGHQVRFDDHCGPDTLVKLMTDGILLAEIQGDRYLNQYDALIVDEAHERSLNIDFLLGYLKQLLPSRPDLKLVITSATIDVDAFSRHFDDAPIVEVSGRSYPVDVHYLPPDSPSDEPPPGAPSSERGAPGGGGLAEQVLGACHWLVALERDGGGHRGGDVLVFLPGERDIRDCAQALRGADWPGWDILPLYARLGRAEQARVFDLRRRRGRRVVLATNVAETSLTVPGIHYVIDTGLARVSRYSHRSRVQRLPIEPIARANAEQRKGRCGRVGPGTCIRLYGEDDFAARPPFTDSEIQRTNLASVILQLARLRFGDVDAFPFLERPDSRLVKDGYRLLDELGALNGQGGLTQLGHALARIPADPRIARMLLAAGDHACVDEVLIIASALSIQDPRERPLDKQQAADQAHARFRHPSSDFLALVALWRHFEEQRQQLSRNQLRKVCQREFLSGRRMFEWRDMHHQLRLVCRQLGLKPGGEPAPESAVHRAVLAGLVGHIGQRDQRREYRGARNRRFELFPGSHLAKKPPPWMVATELVETGKLYARINGRIEPEWVIDAAPRLVRRQHSEPHYSPRHRAVMAREKVTLYGLTLSDGRQVSYRAIDPEAAREVFIRGALVEGQYPGRAPFWHHNQALIRDIQQLETQLRRHDLLVDDEEIWQFYARLLPAGIASVAAFDKWRKRAERDEPRLLYLSRAQLLRRDPGDDAATQFPAELTIDDLSLPLRYTFAPGGDADGVSATVPLAALKRLSRARCEWLVPGLLRDKCIELVKTLPKPVRKRFVPVPDHVDRALARMRPGDEPLTDALGRSLCAGAGGGAIAAADWQPERLAPFYRMHFRVIGDDGAVLAAGRDLDALTAQLHEPLRALVGPADGEAGDEPAVYRGWDFGAWRPTRQIHQGGMRVTLFTALVDRGDGVALEWRDTEADAAAASRLGLGRLCALGLARQVKALKKDFLRGNKVQLQLGSLRDYPTLQRAALWDDYVLAVCAAQCQPDGEPFPADRAAFEALLQARGAGLYALGQVWHEVLLRVIERMQAVQRQLGQLDAAVWRYALDDIRAQLDALLGPRFLLRLPPERLRHYPRYLEALDYRLSRLRGHYQKDQRATEELARHWRRLCERVGPDEAAMPGDTALARYRWLLEEYRVSLFAQHLGAAEPVSAKRLDALWQTLPQAGTVRGR